MPKDKIKTRAIIHASELLTGAGVRKKDGRFPTEDDLGKIEDGALVYEESNGTPGKILWVGRTRDLPKQFLRVQKRDLKCKEALIPGMIDCHTHLIFSGDRADEFAERCAGKTYQQIANSGGGIQKTVRSTRSSTDTQLLILARKRIRLMRDLGVRVIEIKSGYGLDLPTELRCLRVAQKLKHEFKDLVFSITYMGAHDLPFDKSRAEYIDEILNQHLVQIAQENLADACDVFIDTGYYTLEEAELILTKAKKLGMKIKVHADELSNTESANFAVRMKALSADHLLKVSEMGIKALANSQTTAVLLPGTALYLKTPPAPARKLISNGVRVAVSTDFNPGSCPCPSLPLVLSLSALHMGMSRAELFASVTYNAACALGLEATMGTLQKGKRALFTIIPGERFESLYYGLGFPV